MPARAHSAYSVRIHLFLRIAVRDCAGKIEQNPVRMDSGLNRRLNWGTERDFHAHIASIPRHPHILYRRRSAWDLRRGGRRQEHKDREMFPNGRHLFLTLASARLDFRVAACLILLVAHRGPTRDDQTS